MKSAIGIILLLTVFVLSGCSTVQVSQDYDTDSDLAHYGTWQWQEAVQPKTGDIRADNPLLNKRIRRAIEDHFSRRRFAMSRERPDIYVSYHLAIERKIYSDTYYGALGAGSYYDPWYGGIGRETRIWQYDESRLTIDIHDADTGELVWRGVGTYRFKDYETPEAAQEAARHTVDKILQQFPPGHPPGTSG